MPDEDMEITTDLAQPGFAEDIDIDLDFAQPDEDMELADFDQAQDMQNFNSDARDELMAEGDDESFGMVDAEDIMHNEAATAANDIEIDIGGPDDGLLPEVTAYEGAPQEVDELDFTETIGAEDPNLETGDWFQESTDQVAGSIEQVQVDTLEVPTITTTVDAASVLESATTIPAEADLQGSPSGGAEQNDHLNGEARLQDVASEENIEHDGFGTADEVENSGIPIEPSTYSLDGTHDEKHHDAPGSEGQENGEADGPEHVQQVQFDEAGGVEADPLAGDDFEEQQPAEDGHPTTDTNVAENDLGDESYDEHVNDENNAAEGNEKEGASLDNSHPQIKSEAQDHSTAEGSHEGSSPGEVGANHDVYTEHPASIAIRHEISILYGQTDYRLFAKSEDDDPNHYFLKDPSALELSLAEFLSSLRDVISEEVSPLDELVMHVDGLGLEFAESTTSDFLEKITFGGILKLYDELVKNDEAETSPGLYCYLMVRPSCSQRLMALLDSANSGRGLSEIAVYRETTPFDEAHDSEPGSPALSASLDDGEADEAYEYNEADAEENEFDEDDTHADRDADETADLGDDFESKSAEEADAAALETTNPTENTTEIPAETAKETATPRPEDDLLSFYDEELDLSPSKEDHPVQSPPKDQGDDALEEDPATHNDAGVRTPGGHTPPATSFNGSIEAPNSDNTSPTATLNGDDHDEIDYSDDDDDTGNDVGNEKEATSVEKPAALATSKAPVDEEITWESENEEAKNGVATSISKGTVQVSSPHGKRTRSESDNLDGEGEQSDVKRRRP